MANEIYSFVTAANSVPPHTRVKGEKERRKLIRRPLHMMATSGWPGGNSAKHTGEYNVRNSIQLDHTTRVAARIARQTSGVAIEKIERYEIL